MTGQVIKMQLKDKILVSMKRYLNIELIQILDNILTQEFVKVNIEEITTLPAETRDSIDKQNREVIELFLYKKRCLKKGTKENYMRAIKKLITLVNKPLVKIDDLDIYNYLQWYENRNLHTTGKKNQNSTVNNERLYLSGFFSWMRKEKLRSDNPVESTEKKKVIRKPIDYFRSDDIAKLRDACVDERERAIIEVFRSTGARVGEVVSIMKDNID